jgi:hypothetical protein
MRRGRSMDTARKELFLKLWKKYFKGADLPLVWFYADTAGEAEIVRPKGEHRCIFSDIRRVSRGRSLAFDNESVHCFGGKRYLGFSNESRPDLDYFLSTGIPGAFEGERYKKTPEIVRKIMNLVPAIGAPKRFIVFKRWDHIADGDEPAVVFFFAPPDVLSGLFTLFNFDEVGLNGVVSPFGAGCSTIALHPLLEGRKKKPRAVLGMFDVSARPCIPQGLLSFAVPMKRFGRMVDNMEESFLTTASWGKVRSRIGAAAGEA